MDRPPYAKGWTAKGRDAVLAGGPVGRDSSNSNRSRLVRYLHRRVVQIHLPVRLQVADGTQAMLVGSRRQAAVAALTGAGFTVQVFAVPDPGRAGTVVAQSPAAGTRVGSSDTVQITVTSH